MGPVSAIVILNSKVRRVIVVGAHLALWTAAYLGAFLLRFDGRLPPEVRPTAYYGLAFLLLARVAVFWPSGLFHGLLRYAGISEVRSIVRATTLASIVFVGAAVLVPALRQPRSVYAGEWMLAILAASALRFGARVLREPGVAPTTGGGRAAILLGAGDAGELLLRDLARSPHPELRIVTILDDAREKHGSSLRGIRVLGAVDEATLLSAKERFGAELAVLALPSASGARTREIVAICRRLGIQTKTLPSLQQILTDEVKVSMLRDIAIEDLLRREPVKLDEASMAALLRGKRVLVTGGAGSIGSELSRQAARYEPAGLALLDHDENGLFFLERQLRATFPALDLVPFVADVKDAARVGSILRTFRPHVVLHAAAHKHVPLMEANPSEAIKNNVFGTRVVADLANACSVETFVLISTDKAVNPTSVMGATKRIAEMYLQSIASRARTRFVAVRFGNVLGSAGSVVPVFREQIAAGGPVTVTHPEMTRYFMTIPEAAQLVLQAGALAKGGEIFLLDMGEPVKIVDLARDMIRMSGLEPDVDIPIVFVGKRVGEKLHEELLLDHESHDRTVHPKIVVGQIAPVAEGLVDAAMVDLAGVLDASSIEVRKAIARVVPEARLEGTSRGPRDDVDRLVDELGAIDTLSSPRARSLA